VAGYYADEDVPVLAARIARGLGLDILHTEELGRKGVRDQDQLLFAARQGRILITRNCKDFWPMSEEFAANQSPHAGVLCITKSLEDRPAAEIARALVAFDRAHTGGVPPYYVDYLHAVP